MFNQFQLFFLTFIGIQFFIWKWDPSAGWRFDWSHVCLFLQKTIFLCLHKRVIKSFGSTKKKAVICVLKIGPTIYAVLFLRAPKVWFCLSLWTHYWGITQGSSLKVLLHVIKTYFKSQVVNTINYNKSQPKLKIDKIIYYLKNSS